MKRVDRISQLNIGTRVEVPKNLTTHKDYAGIVRKVARWEAECRDGFGIMRKFPFHMIVIDTDCGHTIFPQCWDCYIDV